MSRRTASEYAHDSINAAERLLEEADDLRSRDFTSSLVAALERLSLRVEALTHAQIANAIATAAIADRMEDRR